MLGVTVTIPVIGEEPELRVLKEGTLPVPDSAKPIAVVVFVQLIVAPPGLLIKFRTGIIAPEQTVISEGSVMPGKVLTVTVIGALGLSHPFIVCDT